jgi:hypothetical protein
LLEVVHEASSLVHIEQTGYLDQPSYIGREQLIVNDPSRKLIPLFDISTVDGNAPFDKLVLARFEIRYDFFGDFSQVSALDKVVCLQENGSET